MPSAAPRQPTQSVGDAAPDSSGWIDLELLFKETTTDYPLPFLGDDLKDDDVFEDNPNARASFGLFDGDENRILLQEIAPGGN